METNIKNKLVEKLSASGDKIGAAFISVGLQITKNKKRNTIVNEAVKETDSCKCLIVSEIFV